MFKILKMNRNNLVKTFLILIAIGGMVALALVIFIGKYSNNPDTAKNTENISSQKDEVKNAMPIIVSMEGEGLPEGFPFDMPINKQTERISSSVLKYPDATQASVYKFYSSETIAQNLAFYQDWAEKNGWQINDVIKTEEQYSLFLLKDAQSLGVKIGKENGKVKVSLDLLKK